MLQASIIVLYSTASDFDIEFSWKVSSCTSLDNEDDTSNLHHISCIKNLHQHY